MKQFLSKRGCNYVKDMPPLMEAHFSIVDKLYHPKLRTDGYINMGTAETHLIDKEICALVNKVQSRLEIKSEHIHYDFSYGTYDIRSAISEYWQKLIFKDDSIKRIKPENIIITTGCSGALEMLSIMLGDPNDVFLIPTPFYSGFCDDINGRALLDPVGVHAGTHLSIDAFEKALNEQKEKGRTVRCVLLSSPNNPAGTVYSAQELKNLIDFCIINNLDIISDELYAQTIHDPSAVFVSVLELVPEFYLHRVHVTGSFSKDFALSGFRTGFIISYNTDMIKGLQVLSYYSSVSNHTQSLLAALLRNPELPDVLSNGRKLLRRNFIEMTESLASIGVETMPAQGGIFLFSNFAKYMEDYDYQSEFILWEKLFYEKKINITPGQLFRSKEPGWFRICSAHPVAEVDEACRRFKTL